MIPHWLRLRLNRITLDLHQAGLGHAKVEWRDGVEYFEVALYLGAHSIAASVALEDLDDGHLPGYVLEALQEAWTNMQYDAYKEAI